MIVAFVKLPSGGRLAGSNNVCQRMTRSRIEAARAPRDGTSHQ
jgi:hypothetical protein